MNQPDEQSAGADSESDPKQPEPTELAVDAAATGDDEQHSDALPRFVTKLAPLEEQVGVHVITALQHPKTLAVLTTVATDGGGGQQVVSIALDADRFEQIQRLLATAPKAGKRRVRCVGFHCHFEDDDPGDDDESGSSAE
ncbi:MAG: hypothetical protein HON53_01855 [Planctomycetaceae bacterium]|jgi:hypothetical protein|nr:hypothetical protein [Planctomycetaceae bacterium]MBT6157371.1 hypothetical protein [Planctomycetaceae bacterium]MBT6483465.1 hypothetical protein [Planctomycetaceae bacterium]MBT6496201.1 hypothetical protein [Planctomycetaceae bacterium]